MTIGEGIKKARKKASLSQSQLAKRLGVTQSMIAQYECGNRHPKYETLKKICEALEVNFYDFMDDILLTVSDEEISNMDTEKKYLLAKMDYSKSMNLKEKESEKRIHFITQEIKNDQLIAWINLINKKLDMLNLSGLKKVDRYISVLVGQDKYLDKPEES